MAKQFWAQLIEMDEEIDAASISGATDYEEAAESLIADFVGQMGGEITQGVVRVWIQGGAEKVYDWQADFTIPDDAGDDDEIEVEGEIELRERL